jgi:zinc and cadmium transporter
MLELLAFVLCIMFASLVGVVSVWHRAGSAIERNLRFLVSFSAGVFLIVTYQLSMETIEHAPSTQNGLLWIGIGALLVWLLFKILPDFHDHADESEAPHAIEGRRVLIADGMHNIGDGILLAASFAVGGTLGVATAASVFVHELVQEVSEFFVLRSGGYSTKKALAVNSAVSSTILIGALGGFYLLETFEMFEVPLLGIAAGSFFVVVLHDLIPHSIQSSRTLRHYAIHILLFGLGIALMLGVGTLGAH